MSKQVSTKLEIISDILNSKYVCKNQNQLVEKDKDSKGKPFYCCYNVISKNYIPYKLYKFEPNIKNQELFPYFSNESGLKQICDYILFAEYADYLYVFLIELKKNPYQTKPQLLASKSFVEYIITSARRIGMDIGDNINYVLIRIIDKNVTKKRKPDESKNLSFDKDKYCNYPYNVFRIKELIDKV